MTPLQQAAQAALAQWDDDGWIPDNSVQALRKALEAEQAQAVEPVAIYRGAVDCGEHGAFNLELLKMIPRGAKLYTHPAPSAKAQQVAVPMTTTEIRKVYAFVPYREIESTVNYLDFARAIEAHHGIKAKLVTKPDSLPKTDGSAA